MSFDSDLKRHYAKTVLRILNEVNQSLYFCPRLCTRCEDVYREDDEW